VFEQEDERFILLNVGDVISGILLIIAIKMIGLDHCLLIFILLLIVVLQVLLGENQQDEQSEEY
jgi:hypothetical protein